MIRYLVAESPRRAPEAWRHDDTTYQQLDVREGELVEHGQPSTPSVFESHRNVSVMYGATIWRECTEAEAIAALSSAHRTPQS